MIPETLEEETRTQEKLPQEALSEETVAAVETPDAEVDLAESVRDLRPSILQHVRTLSLRPGVTSFALGMPASELFPAADLAAASQRVLPEDAGALQYSMPYAPLKEQICEMMAWRGVRCSPEQVFLTSGAQQGMALVAQMLLDPGDSLVVEETVYEGLKVVTRTLRPEYVTVPTNPEEGPDLDVLEQRLASGKKPAFIYLITDGHNPLGSSIPSPKRWRLVELAARYRVPILEDDAYGLLYYGDAPPPPLRALDERWVLYLGSFSKILAPGLRVGWLVAPEKLVPRLAALKQGADIDVGTYAQRVVSAYLAERLLAAHLDDVRVEYRRRRDAALRTLEDRFPAGVSWNRPRSGLYIWLELPQEVDTLALLDDAVERHKVAFAPGAAFAVHDSPYAARCLRIAFANNTVEQIEDGLTRLGRAVEEALNRR